MKRSELEHAIRAACDVVHETEIIVIGSQAVLGQFSDAHPDLRYSRELDVYPRIRPETADRIDGMLGERVQTLPLTGKRLDVVRARVGRLVRSPEC